MLNYGCICIKQGTLEKKGDNLWLIIIPQLTIIYIYTCNDTDHQNSSSVKCLT